MDNERIAEANSIGNDWNGTKESPTLFAPAMTGFS